LKQALNNFVSTREITDQIENKAQKIDALSSLALQHAETGQYREAKKIFSAAEALANNMDEPGHNVKMLSLIASRQGQTRFINQANANLQQALLVAKKILYAAQNAFYGLRRQGPEGNRDATRVRKPVQGYVAGNTGHPNGKH